MPARGPEEAEAAASVSVVIPVRGPAPYLEEALTSVASQSHRPGEVIVVDDRAGPGLEGRVRAALPGARLLRSAEPGLASARNAGIEAASGGFVAFLDADDVWLPRKIERQAAALASSPEAGVACSAFLELREGRIGPRRPRRSTFLGGDALEAVVLDDIVIPSAAVCRREVLREAGGFPNRPHFEDFALFSRLALAVPFVFCPEPLVLYRRHELQMTSTVASGVPEARSELTELLLARLPPERAGADFSRRARAHDQAIAGHWHREQGRRGRALACAGRGIRLWWRSPEPWALAASAVLPRPLERLARRLVDRPRRQVG